MKTYTLNINGVEHRFQMTPEDAKRHGATEVKEAAAPANKARTAVKNKDA